MPSSPSSSAQAARQRLGGQLREMRTAARLPGVRFAELAGWRDSSLVSRIEKGQRTITPDHVRLWCRICGASPHQEAELLAEQGEVSRMWQAYRELSPRVGLNATQKMGVGDMFDQLSLYRSYQTKLPHGLVQTRDFMTGVLAGVREERHVEVDDVAEAVDERMSRQVNLRKPGKRFAFIVEEHVLRVRMFRDDVHREQLLHLLEVTRLPAVIFGVIPMDADREGYRIREAFSIVDDNRVTIELISGYLSLSHPAEVAMYTEAWEHLRALAVFGPGARALIRSAIPPS